MELAATKHRLRELLIFCRINSSHRREGMERPDDHRIWLEINSGRRRPNFHWHSLKKCHHYYSQATLSYGGMHDLRPCRTLCHPRRMPPEEEKTVMWILALHLSEKHSTLSIENIAKISNLPFTVQSPPSKHTKPSSVHGNCMNDTCERHDLQSYRKCTRG
jgi:hypothetical protein